MKNLTLLIAAVFILFSSCKKEEEQPEPYVSFASQIIGTWKLVSATNNSTESTETYPGSIDGTTVVFNNKSEINFYTACNDGEGHYIVSENGAIIIYDVVQTQLACVNLPAEWENKTTNGLKNAFHATVSSNSLVLTSDGVWSLNFSR